MLTNLFFLILSILAMIVWGVYFSHKQDAIRLKIQNSRKEWVHGYYVFILLGAATGKARSGETSLIAYLFLGLVLLGASAFVGIAHLMMQDYYSRQARLESNAEQVRELRANLVQEGEQGKPRGKGEIWKDLNSLDANITKELRWFEKEWSTVLSGAYLMRISGYMLYCYFYFALLVWHPFVKLRSKFAYELERFTQRIQGLASKSELAELAMAEVSIKDEESIRRFFEVSWTIAKRHGVPDLVKTFDLWEIRGGEHSSR